MKLNETGANDSCWTTAIIIWSWVKRCIWMIIERWIYGAQLLVEEYNGVPFVKQSVPGIVAAGKRQGYVIGTYAQCLDDFFLFFGLTDPNP